MVVLIALALLTAAPTRTEAETLMTLACSMPSALELEIVTLLEAAKVGALLPPVLAELWVSVVIELPTRFSTTPTPSAMPKPAATEVPIISELSLAAEEAALMVKDPEANPADVVLAWLRKAWLAVLAVMLRLLGSVLTAAAV